MRLFGAIGTLTGLPATRSSGQSRVDPIAAVYLLDSNRRKQPILGVEMRQTIVRSSTMRNLAVVAALTVAVCAVYWVWTGRLSFQCTDLGGRWIETTGECIGSPYWEEFISR